MSHDHGDMCWRTAAIETVQQVRAAVLSETETEAVGLDDVSGRVLAESITASRTLPEYDRATMDGYAFDATDEYPLTVVEGEVYPEDDPPSIDEGEAVEIATGASLPPEANAVLKREESTVDGDQLTGTTLEVGTYTYERGSNVERGEVLFERGERLSPKDAVFLGDLGYDSVDVRARLSVGVLATGTEIHEGRQSDLDSNMLVGLVRSWGHEATYEGTVPDEYDRVREAIADLETEYDVLLTTGGTSVGHKDHVVRALSELGEVRFHRVRVRPGKPLALAELPEAVAFAVPGKPLGAHTIATLVVRPFFTGESTLPSLEATCARDVELGPEGFEYAVPVTLDDGEALPLGHADSALRVYDETFDPSVLSSSTRATRADGFVLTRSALDGGEAVDVVPYPVVE
ncbi:molybdopterin molybdotransferase MoeA [Halomarina ordinaria]|uniref:Molybdopterin molybdotransferase MoeA n=1 Tax=Halomarina ordinaria TaxID=3033939 RepID=A0ABD5UEN9_9EURY|nr:molybdopterin molybdotransferase MoeA [Halomarina sp. PSRA2]